MALTYPGGYGDCILNAATGGVLRNAAISIYAVGTTNPAPLYSDRSRTPRVNPVNTDANGNLVFWAEPGSYDLVAGASRCTIFIGPDGDDVAATGGGVRTVNTRTGDVVVTKADVGLGSTDNVPDASKPISTATQAALDAKAPLVRAVTVAYASTITPNAATTDVLNVGTLTGALTLANPSGSPRDGQALRIRLNQDGTGGRVITFGGQYHFGTDVTTSMIPTTPLADYELLVAWCGFESTWRVLALARGF